MMLCTILVAVLLFNSIDSNPVPEGHGKLHIVSEKILPDGAEVIEYSYETSSAIDEAIERAEKNAAILKTKVHAKLVAGEKKEAEELLGKEIKERIIARAEEVEKLGWEILNRKISSKKASEFPGCDRDLLDGAATIARDVLDKAVTNLQQAVNDLATGSAVDVLGGGAAAVLIHAVDSVYDAVSDVTCGINNGAKIAAEALDTGDFLGGAIAILKDIGDTLGNTVSNVAAEAVSGVADAAGAVATVGETALSDAADAVHKAASTALNIGHDAAEGVEHAVHKAASTALNIGHDAAEGVGHAVDDVLGFLSSLL